MLVRSRTNVGVAPVRGPLRAYLRADQEACRAGRASGSGGMRPSRARDRVIDRSARHQRRHSLLVYGRRANGKTVIAQRSAI